MREFEILGIEVDEESNRYLTYMEITEDDGTVRGHVHLFPSETLEWRMAEYDCTLDEAIDMVMGEAFVTTEEDAKHPNFLYNAATVEESKAWHLERCRRHKNDKRTKTPRVGNARKTRMQEMGIDSSRLLPGDDPYAALAAHVQPDPELIELMRDHVSKVRKDKKDQKIGLDRKTQLKQQLRSNDVNPHRRILGRDSSG